MPFILVFIGIILVVSGIQDTQKDLGAQLAKDFTGPGNFVYWFLSIFLVGLIGYIPGFDKFSKAFIALIVVVLFLKNGGFISQLNAALTTQPASSSGGSSGILGGITGGSSGGSSGGLDISSLTGGSGGSSVGDFGGTSDSSFADIAGMVG